MVAIQTDPSIDRPGKNKPVQTLEERKTVLRGIKWVDEIRVYSTEEELWNMLSFLAPDVRILGADWKDRDYTGHDLGHEVFFNSRNHSWSSADLRRRVYEAELKKRA